MNQQKKQQIILVVIGALALVAATYIVAIGPQRLKMTENEATKKEFTEKKEKADAMIAKEAEFKSDLAAVQQRLGALEGQMAQGDVFLWMNARLREFKTKYNFKVDIPSVDRELRVPVGVIPDFPYQAALFRVTGTGYFHDIGSYIRTFENDHPFIRVQNIMMQPAPSVNPEEQSEKLSFSMELVTLIKPVVEGAE